MGELKPPGKPFDISKWEVQDAWKKVKANKGAPGIDGVALAEFESDLKNNLYRIWNRMSSGSYFPPPVKAVEIPKPHGSGTRILGVPTVADRIAQTVVAARLEKAVEPVFHHALLRVPARKSQPWTRWRHAGNGAGRRTGCSTWTSRSSSTACDGT